MDLDIVKVGISVIIAVVGWIIGHHFNSRRDAAANRKKLMTEYLVGAYRKLNLFACVLASGAKGTASLVIDINSAVSDIQLFGTQKQIRLVKEISKHILAGDGVHNKKLVELLRDLRDSLRGELGLNAIDFPITHLHLEFSATKPNQPNE